MSKPYVVSSPTSSTIDEKDMFDEKETNTSSTTSRCSFSTLDNDSDESNGSSQDSEDTLVCSSVKVRSVAGVGVDGALPRTLLGNIKKTTTSAPPNWSLESKAGLTKFSLPQIKQTPLNNMSILIVDDSTAYSIKLKKMLSIIIPKMNGCIPQIICTTNVFAALHVLSKYQFSFVLVDNIFSNSTMTGIELCHRLHARNTLTAELSPLVVISAQSQNTTIAATTVAGAPRFEHFSNVVDKHLINMNKLQDMVHKHALPMTQFNAMHAVTNSLHYLDTNKNMSINQVNIPQIQQGPNAIASRWREATKWNLVKKMFNRTTETKKKEMDLFDKMMWEESDVGRLHIQRKTITDEKTRTHLKNRLEAAKRAKCRDNILEIMKKKMSEEMTFEISLSSSDDSDSSDDEEEQKRKRKSKTKKKKEQQKQQQKKEKEEKEEEEEEQKKLKQKKLPSSTVIISFVDQLCSAVKSNNLPHLKRLLGQRTEKLSESSSLRNNVKVNDINDINKHGLTALHIAAGLGRHAMIDLFIQHQANVNIAPNSYTPYAHALNSVTKGLGSTQQTLDLLILHGAKLSVDSKVENLAASILRERERHDAKKAMERKGGKKRSRRRKTSMRRSTGLNDVKKSGSDPRRRSTSMKSDVMKSLDKHKRKQKTEEVDEAVGVFSTGKVIQFKKQAAGIFQPTEI